MQTILCDDDDEQARCPPLMGAASHPLMGAACKNVEYIGRVFGTCYGTTTIWCRTWRVVSMSVAMFGTHLRETGAIHIVSEGHIW